MSFLNPQIKVIGIVFQNSHGSKYYSRYYLSDKNKDLDLCDPIAQKKLQQNLLKKVQKMNVIATLRPEQTEIFTLNAYTVLFKVIDQLQIYLIIQDDENYVLMEKVIDTIGEVLLLITKGPYTGKIVFDYLHDIVLAVDQIIHEGYIVCLESGKVYDRLRMKEIGDTPSSIKPQQKPQQQQPQQSGAFSSLFGFAKNTLGRTLNLG